MGLIVSLLLASGCGYSTARLLPAKYQVIYIESFENAIPITQEFNERTGLFTSLPQLEEKVTRGVIDQFLFDGNLRVTNEPDKADLKLTAKLTDFYRQAVRHSDNDLVSEYRLNLTASLTLRDREGQIMLEDVITGDTTYFTSGTSSQAETTAVDTLVRDFSRRIVEWVIEYW
jgi:outer membrane lipopolysaccharide assembly protein LptE/RlpB